MSREPVAARPEGAVLLRAAAIAAAALWVYWPALRGTWLWDDALEVARNPMAQAGSGWWKPWVDGRAMDYLPLKASLQWAEWHAWSDHVLGYHLTNVALHAACALLLWRVLALLGVRTAWLGGLLFAVHPMAVESVAWIAELKNPLSLMFMLLALLAYQRWEVGGGRLEDRALQPPTSSLLPRPPLASLLFYAAAMLSKSSAVMFPLALLLLAWWRRGRIGKRDIIATAPFFGVSIALGAVAVWFQAHRAIGIAGVGGSFAARLAQAGASLAAYFWHTVFPARLAPVYTPVRSDALGWLAWAAVLAVIAGAGVSAREDRAPPQGAFPGSRRGGYGRHVLLGLGWFGLFLLPVLGLVPMAYLRVAPRADHLAYVSLAGIIGLAAAAFGQCIPQEDREDREAKASDLPDLPDLPVKLPWLPRWLPRCAAFAVVLVLAMGARRYAANFRSAEALWTMAVRREPGAWLAHNNLGRVLLEAGRPAEAAAQFRESIRLQPDSAEAHANLGNALGGSGEPAGARSEYEAALRIDPAFAGGHYDLGLWYLLAGRPAEAEGEFRAALRLDPQRAYVRNNLGLALFRQGRPADAMAEYRRALALDPHLPEAHLNLGNALYQEGKLAEAVAQYREAVRESPAYADAHHNLGHALLGLGRYEEARAELDEAERWESRH